VRREVPLTARCHAHAEGLFFTYVFYSSESRGLYVYVCVCVCMYISCETRRKRLARESAFFVDLKEGTEGRGGLLSTELCVRARDRHRIGLRRTIRILSLIDYIRSRIPHTYTYPPHVPLSPSTNKAQGRWHTALPPSFAREERGRAAYGGLPRTALVALWLWESGQGKRDDERHRVRVPCR
jgi:hypothetical protein